MTDFQDAVVELNASVAANRGFLQVQDVPATLNATMATLTPIRRAAIEWTRALTSLKVIAANTDPELVGVLQDPVIVDLRQTTASLVEHIAEVKSLIEKLAERARSLP